MCVHVEEEMPNVRGLAAFGIGCQLVHQLFDDASPIHHLPLIVGKKQSDGKDKSDVIRLFRAEDKH